MPCKNPCDQCEQTGLPILFTRYAAAYSATREGMSALDSLKPGGQLKAQPGGVALQTAKYNVRMLRMGYLYIRTSAYPLTPEWEAFAVHPHGYFSRMDIDDPYRVSADPSCRPNEWGATRSLVWIKNGKNIQQFHFMFHPDPIDPKYLKEVIGNAPDKYMQKFDVAGWAKGSTSQPDTMLPDQLDAKVLEFKALKSGALQTLGNEQTFGLMGCTPAERDWGDSSEVHEGPHYAGGRNETHNPDGSTTVTDSPGLPGSISNGVYTAQVLRRTYDHAHGPRLRKIVEYLKLDANKGAVVACEDAIGIAQELSMHHMTAATPYVKWLQEKDAKGVTNQCKQAAAQSIGTLQLAMQKSMVSAYDARTQDIRRSAANVINNPSLGDGVHRVTLPDGSVKVMTEKEHNKYLHDKWEQEASNRDSDRGLANKGMTQEILSKTSAFYDQTAINTFNTLHQAKLKARDALLDTVSADLLAWFDATALYEKALGRYNPKINPADHPDGQNCAGQLCAMLMQVASAPKGRDWYSKNDPFKPGDTNLVWRMLSFNSTPTGDEIKAALATLEDPLPPPWQAGKAAQSNAAHQQAIGRAATALGMMGKVIGGAEKVDTAKQTLMDKTKGFGDKAGALQAIGKAAKENILTVLLSSTIGSLKKLPPTEIEKQIARAQVMALGHGMGGDAARYVRSNMTSVAQGRRVPATLGVLSLLGTLASLAKADARKDARSFSEFAASAAGAMGLLRQWNVEVYEAAYFKQVSLVVSGEAGKLAREKGFAVPAATAAEETAQLATTSKELLRLKALAARYVVAGAVVGVWWDAVDANTAKNEAETSLEYAYIGRTITGAVTIYSAVVGARYTTAPLWLTRLNIGMAIATAALTYVVGQLKGDAWANWLKAQPFRAAQVPVIDSSLDKAAQFMHLHGKSPAMEVNRKTPFRNEDEMMAALANTLSEMD